MPRGAQGPAKYVCDLVDERDGQRCVRCGRSLHQVAGSRHHRQLRRHGNHTAANLVLLCGSGTTGCHGWVHSEPAAARALGLIVRGTDDPSWVPVYSGYLRQWLTLSERGYAGHLTPKEAHERLESAGYR